ncbi:hypothetical protein LCGC14_1835120 [marine sediment metagenome]|uniref:Uncharacterized protein n=1 Tax=marine sediment metagenome TaxID=412755 RepID=A0A0F9GEX8_9ZZZZ
MVEETPKETKEEKQKTVLQEAKDTKTSLVEASEIAEVQIAQLKDLKAEELLSGKAEVTKPEEKVEESNADYAKKALEGKIEEK